MTFTTSLSLFLAMGVTVVPTALHAQTTASAFATWTTMPGSLTQISAGADGSVWGLSQEVIWQWDGTSNKWNRIPGALAQVAVGGSSQVWGVNRTNVIFKYSGNGQWATVPGALKQISAASDGTVMGINTSSKIVKWTGTGWEQLPDLVGPVEGISTGSAQQIVAWTTNAEFIYKWSGSAWARLGSGQIGQSVIRQMAVSFDGTLLGASNANSAYVWNNGSWLPLRTATLLIAPVSRSAAWALSTSLGVLRTNNLSVSLSTTSPGSCTAAESRPTADKPCCNGLPANPIFCSALVKPVCEGDAKLRCCKSTGPSCGDCRCTL